MAKTATLRARTKPDLEAAAETVLMERGLARARAITLSYREVAREREIPFPLRLPGSGSARNV